MSNILWWKILKSPKKKAILVKIKKRNKLYIHRMRKKKIVIVKNTSHPVTKIDDFVKIKHLNGS